MKDIEVHYHAMLREARGVSSESLRTDADTAADLYKHLAEAHHFRLPQSKIKVAVNNEMTAWDRRLQQGDVVVFVPPTAGG